MRARFLVVAFLLSLSQSLLAQGEAPPVSPDVESAEGETTRPETPAGPQETDDGAGADEAAPPPADPADPADPANAEPEDEPSIAISFSGTMLKEAIKVFEGYTGKRFLFDDTLVSGRRIHLLSSRPIPVANIDEVFESILEVQGLTLVESGDEGAELYKIVDVTAIAGKATPTFTADMLQEIPDQDRVVTLVYQLRYILADQVAAAFKDMTTVPGGIQAIGGTNLLRITDYASNVRRIGDILDSLDEMGPNLVRETIELEHALPEELVQEIKPILDIESRVYMAQLQKQMEARLRQAGGKSSRSSGSSQSSRMLNTAAAITVAAIPRLRSVIVSATEDKIEEVKELIKSLDIEDPEGRVIKYYALKVQAPSRLAEALARIFDVDGARGRRDGSRTSTRERSPLVSAATSAMSIVPDDDSRQLVVVASTEKHEEIAAVITQLDTSPEQGRELRYFPVEHAELDELSATISKVFGLNESTARGISGRDSRRATGEKGENLGIYTSEDLIVADRNLSSLIVVARKEVLDKVGEMVQQLDVEGPGEKTIEYYALKFAKPEDIAATLSTLFSDSATSRRTKRWPPTPAKSSGDRAIVAVPNATMGAVIVLADGVVHAEIKEVIKNLDVETSVLELKYYALEHAEIDEVAQVLGRLFKLDIGADVSRVRSRSSREADATAGLSEDPVIIPDANLQALIVLAQHQTHELIQAALTKLDVEGPGNRVTRYYKLTHNTVSNVAAILSGLFGSSTSRSFDRSSRKTTSTGKSKTSRSGAAAGGGAIIAVDEEQSTVVVSASLELQAEVAKVVAELDVEGPNEKKVAYYKLQFASPEGVAETLATLYPTSGGATSRKGTSRTTGKRSASQGDLDRSITVVADEKTSTVMVLAVDEVQQEIADVVKNLDVESARLELQYYTILHADLHEVAQTLSRLFKLDVGSDAARVKAKVARGGETGFTAGLSEEPVIIPDENLQALIVLAEKGTHALVKEALTKLDVKGPGDRVTRYYTITHNSVSTITSILTRLFASPSSRLSGGSSGRTSVGRTSPSTGGGVIIAADEDQSTVVVSASVEIQAEIAAVVAELDVEGPNEKKVAYYKLKFASPESVANTLSMLYPTSQGATSRGRTSKAGAYRPPGRSSSTPGSIDRSITVVAEEKTSTVMVLAVDEVQQEIAAVLENLDVESARLELKYYTIQHAAILEVAQTLSRLFKLDVGADASRLRSRTARGGEAGFTAGLSEEPVIIPDENLQALIVLAETGTHALVEEAIAKLDVKGPGDRVTRYYKITHNSVATITSILTRLFASPTSRLAGRSAIRIPGRSTSARSSSSAAGGAVITADDAQSTVVVSASLEIQEEIAAVVAELDVEGPNEKKVAYYKLQFASPEGVANTLTTLYPTARTSTFRGLTGRGSSTQGGIDRSITVVADEKTSTVMVLAVEEVQQEIQDVVKNLDVESAQLELRYYTLQHAELSSVAEAVGRLFQLQVSSGASQTAIRRRLGIGGTGGVRPSSGLSEEPVMLQDTNLNALIILAEKRTHELIEAAITKLDVEGPGERETRYYRIVHTSVAEIASTLSSIFADSPGRRSISRGRLLTSTSSSSVKGAIIVPNEELSMVVVSASKEIHEEIAEVVENLDVESVRDNVLRYYTITHSELEDVAETVSKLFGLTIAENLRSPTGRTAIPTRTRSSTTGQRSPYSEGNIVLVDHNLGSLMIVAPLEVHAEIEPVIEKIDSEGPGKREIKHYPMPRSSVSDVAMTISHIFDIEIAQPSARISTRGRGASPKKSVVIPNQALSSVIVVAPADLQSRVATVIEGMNTIGPDENELQYYQIEKVDLIEAANIVSQIFGIPLGTVEDTFRGSTRQQTVDLLTKERVIIPNENLNTLLVVAPLEMQKEISETIQHIDTVGPRDNVFRMYEVTVSEVTTAAQTISQLFDIKLLDDTYRVTRSRRTALTGPKLMTSPFIMPDEDLGALIVNAPEEIHEEISQVLEKLVTIGRQEKMSIRFYRLKNTNPVEVAAKIGHLFNITVGDATVPETPRTSTRSSRAASTSRRGRTSMDQEEEDRFPPAVAPATEPVAAPSSRLSSKKDFYFEGESGVIPDTNLNSIILIAPEYIHEEVKVVLDTLDVRRPQVLFEVAIFDISDDGLLDIGTEIGTFDGPDSEGFRTQGFSNLGLGNRSTPPTGGFPNTTNVPTDLAGLFIGVTKGQVGNIPLLVRMLQESTDVNILSTPLLLVNDNEEALFSSLQEQPTTSASQGTATTNISFSGFVEAGTVLRITPHVSEGNYIRVEIDLKVDNFFGQSENPGIPPPRSTNQLITSITVPDSRTVVIGGLTTTKRTQVASGIPILSQIPVLGYLFGRRSTEEKTSRLFLFIRPQILDDVEFRDLNQISTSKSIEVHGITGERIVPPDEEVEPDGDGEARDRPKIKPGPRIPDVYGPQLPPEDERAPKEGTNGKQPDPREKPGVTSPKATGENEPETVNEKDGS